MGIKEIKFYEIECDLCKHKITLKNSQEPPKGWAKRRWKQEGGGHYGLPHSVITEICCPACVDQGKHTIEPKYGFSFEYQEY